MANQLKVAVIHEIIGLLDRKVPFLRQGGFEDGSALLCSHLSPNIHKQKEESIFAAQVYGLSQPGGCRKGPGATGTFQISCDISKLRLRC